MVLRSLITVPPGAILCYTLYSIPRHTVPHHTTPYHTLLYSTLLYSTLLCSTMLYCTMLYYTMQVQPPFSHHRRGRGATLCTITWSEGGTTDPGPVYTYILMISCYN